jgi:hypothetical protein
VTEVSTEYEFVGRSDSGNAEIAMMSEDSFADKMHRWSSWTNNYLRGSAS